MNIGVLDYGAGNLKNVCRAIEHLGYKYQLVSCKESVMQIDKLIIPGVGAFKVAMGQLHQLDLVESISQLASQRRPILGICLGMQLLFEESSEFGKASGLNLLQGKVKLIPSTGLYGAPLKVPHIGWNELIIDAPNSILANGIGKDDAVYFVHSYRVDDYDSTDLVAHCCYDGHVLPAIVQRDNIYGCQFHPEKSGELGLEILNNFLRGS